MNETDKYRKLLSVIKESGNVAVAFSGGVDSTLLLKAAVDVCGPDTIAFFARSLLQKKAVEERVRGTCRDFGCTLRIIDFNPLSWPDFTENKANRCYLCKKKIYSGFMTSTAERYQLLDGTNVDDLSRHRPGLQAIKELGVKTPLVEAGFTKMEIRALSRKFGFSCWDLPSESCLATRVLQGVITPELLKIVDEGERLLAENGFYGCRLRLGPGNAYLTISQGDIVRFAASPLRDKIVAWLAKNTFAKVFLELSE
ncbi:MAG: ATP-dependent sacrificial sulfur transferase LarE [Desulfobulbaceae bacterium]|nr:ATP-dependent sacrificial sulfur transferase LarE [Desulfobulbaceae bacterium]